MDGKSIVKLNENLKADRSMWDAMWEDIANNIVFRKQSIVGKMEPGSKMTTKLYDSTATMAAEQLTAWVHANMTAMGMDWFGLKAGDGKDKDVQEWLEGAQKEQMKVIRESNFNGEWLETLADIVAFGTGAIFWEENEVVAPGFNGLNFISMPPGSYSTIEGRNGLVQGLFRELELQAQEAVDRWPDKVSDIIKKDAEKRPSKLHTFVHAVFLSKWFGGDHGTQKEYASYYVSVKDKAVMSQGGFDTFPFAVIPFRRESGESYGRGPGWTALPDVKTAHKSKKLMLKEWALGILPPMGVVDNGVIGSVRLTAGGLTVMKKADSVKPLLTGARFSDNRAKMDDLKATIREIFHGDVVKYIPPRDQTGQMTAYEVARRYQMAQQLLGPMYGNIIFHGLDRMIESTFDMMNLAGAFGDMPGDLRDVKVEYESPLAKAQRSGEVEMIQRTLEMVAGMEELSPGIKDNFKMDDSAVYIAKRNGYPAKLLNSEAERDEIRGERAKAEQEQMALEQAALMAKAAKDGAGAVKDLPAGALEGAIGGR